MHVIKLSGSLCHDPSLLAPLPRPALIVHGGGPQLDEALRGVPVRRIDGLRVTSGEQAETVTATLDDVGDRLAQAMTHLGHRVRRVRATDKVLTGTVLKQELGRVGRVTDIGPVADNGEVVLLTPVAWDEEGPLNVNADDAAAAIAIAQHAESIMFLSNVEGLLKDGQVVPRLDVATADRMIADGTAQDGMVPKLRAAMAAARAGITVRIGSPRCLADPAAGTTLDAEVPTWA